MARLSDIRGFVQKDSVQYSDLVSDITKLQGLVNKSYPAHGAMFEPVAANDLTTPATVANQFTINAGQYRVNGTMVDLPATLVTLSAAPATSGLLSRADLVYLQEDGTVGTFTGTDDSPTMVDAGFSAVAGEVGLWVNGGVYAIPLFTVQRRNQGGYHPYFNEWGTSLFQDGSGGFDYWYEPGALGLPVLDTQDCFDLLVGGSGGISQLGGRPDSKAYNAIYLSDITDLRLQAKAPSPTQLEPNYWQNKAVAGTLKHFVTEGIPKLVVKERGVVETGSTTTAGGTQVGDKNNYATGDFVILINQDGVVKNYGYITRITSSSGIIYCYTTLTDAVENASANGIGAKTFSRVNGDIYTILKVEYTPATFADNTWTDIIGNPANYPRQATGVIDFDTDNTSANVDNGMTVEIKAGAASGTVGNIVMRIGGDLVGVNLNVNTTLGSSTLWLDLGPKATFLANATGLEGFPLLYGENGEDLIPNGANAPYKFKRKATTMLNRTFSSDKGISWGNDDGSTAFDSTTNARTSALAAGLVLFYSYETPAHIYSDAANSSVLGGKLSTCYASNYATATVGGAYISELISKVLTAVINPIGLNKTVEDYAFLVSGDIYPNTLNKPTHAVLGLNDNNSSPAGKVVNYLHDTGSNIELFALFKEMIFDDVNGWGDDNKFVVASNTTTDTDDNGNTTLVGTKSTKLPIVGS